MFMKLLLGLSLSMTSSTLTLNSPILMALNILTVAVSLSVMTSVMISSWYGLLMFLIYIGGMMVMFSYFISLTPNQTLKMKQYMKTLLFSMIMLTPLVTMFMNNLISDSPVIKAYDLYSLNMKPMTIMLILILLMMLLIVVKLAKISSGPLRPFK
uniref:NADH dehydrogenase subunit 6 n=1 Tax=Calliobdella nodulifera TaxID=3385569 RepID=UPI00207AF94F|nr:NADH dehydrogenase subunit 6 [Notostomum cyclostomum]URP31056.1 NADH dehydrogenase subunit 6 [Notostomum cyclostomum]